MRKHWIIYRIAEPFANGRGEVRQGEIYEVNDVSFRAAELRAQQFAQLSPGNFFTVLEVSKVYSAEYVEPVLPPVMEQLLEEAPPVDQNAAENLPANVMGLMDELVWPAAEPLAFR